MTPQLTSIEKGFGEEREGFDVRGCGESDEGRWLVEEMRGGEVILSVQFLDKYISKLVTENSYMVICLS